MNRPILRSASVLIALAALAGLSGCGSPPTNAQYINANGQRMIVDVGRINFQDFNTAANSLVESMLKDGAIKDKRTGMPSLVLVSTVLNDTDQQFDTDQLVANIRSSLLQTGHIQILASGVAGAAPDYVLAGKIMMDKTYAGSINQSEYSFDLAVTDVSFGTIIWEHNQQIVKQGKTSSVGM